MGIVTKTKHKCTKKTLIICSQYCCGCLSLYLLITVMLLLSFLLAGHYLTCPMNSALCTPFTQHLSILYRSPVLPPPMKQSQSVMTTGLIFNIKNDDNINKNEPFLSSECKPYESIIQEYFVTDFNDDRDESMTTMRPWLRYLLLLGESRGGSTYTSDTLARHPQITMLGGEPLFNFATRVCNNNRFLRDQSKCSFQSWIRELFANSFAHAGIARINKEMMMKLRDKTENVNDNDNRIHKADRVIGTKINIEQIPTEFYHDLSSFISCIPHSEQQIRVVQVSRAATIASFWNYQAELIERMKGGDLSMDGGHVPKPIESLKLWLDPQLASQWVRQRDALTAELFARLSFATKVANSRYFYEQLSHPQFGKYHWRSLFAFLGVETEVDPSSLRIKVGRAQTKTHGSLSCSERISNWPEVKQALKGTLSVVACEANS